MIKINYLRIEIQTEKGLYGFESEFKSGLNILTSNDNTKGKSSTLSAIFYALGLEEIIGGKGAKSLSQAYKLSLINEEGLEINVLESRVFLEITNNAEVVTLLRYAKSDTIKDRLIKVYKSPFNKCFSKETQSEDYYVNLPNAATNEKGFHTYLEKFIGIELPLVPSNDGNRKLYLQLLFSLYFIEQKHGWGGIMSGMPIYNISDPRKRVVEYTLGLNTLKNEVEKKRLESLQLGIKQKWQEIQKYLIDLANTNNLVLTNYPSEMKIIEDNEINSICFKKDNMDLDNYIINLKKYIEKNLNTTQKINEVQLDKERAYLEEIQKLVAEKYSELLDKREYLQNQTKIVSKHEGMLEIINKDIINNKDAKKLKELGSELNIKSLNNVCPTCGQEVSDSLLCSHLTMTIDENIQHLEAQRKLYEYTILGQKQIIDKLNTEVKTCENELESLRKLERVLKEDVVRVKNDISEIAIFEKFKIENEIENYDKLNLILDENKTILLKLSKQYSKYLKDKSKLPKDRLDSIDKKKLSLLREKFIEYLQIFRYKSINDISAIEISDVTYLPMSNGFDMKYDTSASDEIRAIWAYLLAISEVDDNFDTNFCKLLIFDEPKQQSIVDEDLKCFFNSIINNFSNKQVIIAATIKDVGTKKVIDELDSNKYHLIKLGDKSFNKLEKKD